MGFLGLFLKFSLECFDNLAWPLVAFVYPLCASIQAIETDSNSDIQKLITYWVCFSLILLFEHAFLKLLLWLPFWTYIKLVIVGCLVTPEFHGSLYVYKHIVHPCLTKDRLFKLKEFFKKDKLLLEVNKDAKETGANSLENVISSKPEVLEPKVVQKDYDDVEIKEKKEFSSDNQVGQLKLALSEKRTCESLDIKEIMAAPETSGDIPKVEPSMNIQKEWACALCQVTTSCEANLISHINGRKHAVAYKQLKAKNQSKASLVSSGTDKSPEIKELSGSKVEVKDDSDNSYLKSSLNPWTCALCKVTATSKIDLIIHFRGKRHGSALENLENSDQTKTSLVNVQNPWNCGICGVTISADKSLVSHLKGKPHQKACVNYMEKCKKANN